jgi:hypothetical protein
MKRLTRKKKCIKQFSEFILAKLSGNSIFRNISCSPGVFYAPGSDGRCWGQFIKLKVIKYYKINSTGQIRLNGYLAQKAAKTDTTEINNNSVKAKAMKNF